MTISRNAILVAAAAILAGLPARAESDDYRVIVNLAYRVIVNRAHAGQAVPREVLAKIFLRQATHWGDGGEIVVVDQSLKSEVRVAFTTHVLKASTFEVLNYWQTQLSRGGIHPPQVKPSDEEVVAFVAATPGAIGYVSGAATLVEGVKSLQIMERIQ